MSQIIRKSSRTASSFVFTMIVMSIYMLWSCNTRVEGCLDVAAANFDLDADRACEGCCTYPPIILSLSQKWNDKNFNTDSIYLDRNNKPYKILDLRYALSSFVWEDVDGNSFTIDSSSISCPASVIRYTPDIVLIEPKRFQYTLDSIRIFPIINNVEFKLGCLMDFDCVDPFTQNPGSVFSDESVIWDSLSNTRAAMRIIVQTDTSMQHVDTLFLQTCRIFDIPYDFAFVPGATTRLDLTVNYAQWFLDADVTSLNSFTNSVISNIEGSFSRTP